MQRNWMRAQDSDNMEVAPSQPACCEIAVRPSALVPVGTYRATLTVISGLNAQLRRCKGSLRHYHRICSQFCECVT